MDTLDYTGPELNKGSRGVMLGIGEKIRDLPEHFVGTLPPQITKVGVFSPGCLVVEGTTDFHRILEHPDLPSGLSLYSLIMSKKPFQILMDGLYPIRAGCRHLRQKLGTSSSSCL